MRRLIGVASLLLAAVPASPLALGQAAELPSYSESAGTEYVMLPVVVQDPRGRFAEDLKKHDFQVTVEGRKIEPDTFERDEQAPASFAFLVDTSGSMGAGSKLETAKASIRHIVANRRSGDDFALFEFADKGVRLVTEFSSDPSALLSALSELEASGQTALFDAVAATPTRMLHGRNSKRAILLFTDGVDNASEKSAVEMAEILQQVSTPVYSIGMKSGVYDLLTEQQRRELYVDNLKILASSSGGKMFLVSAEEDLRPIAAEINSEVRKQYLLGFSPSGKGEVKYRIVSVVVDKPGRWSVRTRRGYRGTAPIPIVAR